MRLSILLTLTVMASVVGVLVSEQTPFTGRRRAKRISSA